MSSARRVTLTQMGFLNHAANESESSNGHDEDETETMPFIDLLGQDGDNANPPVVIDLDSEVEREMEDLEESELIGFGTQLTQEYDFNEVLLEEESRRGQQSSEEPSSDLEESELIDFGTQLTLEYDFNEVLLEEESKREQQSEEPSPQRKRRRISEQPKINGYLLDKSDVAPMVQYPVLIDGTPTWCLPNGRLYKKGETFALLRGNGIYVTIDMVVTKKQQFEVVSGTGGVSVLLARTFIGAKESKRLLQAKSWLEQNPEHPDKALYANRSKLLPQGTIALKALSIKIENLIQRPTPALVYDCGPKISGVGYNFAYRRDSRRSHAKRELPLPRKPVLIDLFAGSGGMGKGFKEAGFYCRYHVEKDYSAVATLRCSHQLDGIFDEEAIIFDEDVDLFLQKVEDKDPAYPRMGDVDHVHASPPCQGFSSANRNGGRNDKTNNELTKRFTKAVEIFRPRTASMENVTGMLSDRNNNVDYLKWVIAELMILGYQVRVTVLNAAEFGDPQARNRVILFAAQNAYKLPDAPKPTHGEKGEKAIVTVKDVLHGLEDVKPVRGSGRVLLPNGEIVLDHNEEGTDFATMGLLNENKPANTVRKDNGIQHYALPRGLTVRERARIQSFPDHYVFCGRTTEKNNQIGNAVPFNLAHAVASSIMKSHNVGSAPDS